MTTYPRPTVSSLNPADREHTHTDCKEEIARLISELPAFDDSAYRQQIAELTSAVNTLQAEYRDNGNQIRKSLSGNGEYFTELRCRREALPVLIANAQLAVLHVEKAMKEAQVQHEARRAELFGAHVNVQQAILDETMRQVGNRSLSNGKAAYERELIKYDAFREADRVLHQRPNGILGGIVSQIEELEGQRDNLVSAILA